VGCRFPDREIEEPWSPSGREEEDPKRADVLRGVQLRQSWYQSRNISLLSVVEKKENSPCHLEEKGNHLIQRIERCDEEAGR
jgi:hypothetical protein